MKRTVSVQAIRFQHARPANYSVQRSAQFMRQCGKKLIFQTIRLFGIRACNAFPHEELRQSLLGPLALLKLTDLPTYARYQVEQVIIREARLLAEKLDYSH